MLYIWRFLASFTIISHTFAVNLLALNQLTCNKNSFAKRCPRPTLLNNLNIVEFKQWGNTLIINLLRVHLWKKQAWSFSIEQLMLSKGVGDSLWKKGLSKFRFLV